jgi:hypothetical protein
LRKKDRRLIRPGIQCCKAGERPPAGRGRITRIREREREREKQKVGRKIVGGFKDDLSNFGTSPAELVLSKRRKMINKTT